MSLPHPVRALLGARLADDRLVDIELDGSTVLAVHPAGTLSGNPYTETLDLTGYLLLTAPAEPHAHLDKALSFDLIRPPLGNLDLAIDSWRRYAATMTVDDIADRARAAALQMLAAGTTAVRSHVDVLVGDDPTRGARALVRVRDELAGLMSIELVALASWRSSDSDIDAVLDIGMDLVGGAPHLAPDPIADLHRMLDIATRHELGVDLHSDESLDGAVTLGAFAAAVRDWTRPVSAGHCCRLGTMQPGELGPIIAEIAASDIGIISLPITNLYLQGWDHPVATPRGLTALQPLLDAGVRVAAGADNVRDPFNPVGRFDALETASLLITAGHLDFETAIHLVTDGARDVMGLPVAGPVPGRVADLLAVRAGSLGDAIAFASPDRIVISGGRVVSRTSVSTETAASSPSTSFVPAAFTLARK